MTTSISRPGHDALWTWFGLSRAGFCVLPRAFMHAMPDEWQAKMATLLEEWDDTWNWDGCDFDGCNVVLKKDGRFTAPPTWLINYRHPDHVKIESFRAIPEGLPQGLLAPLQEDHEEETRDGRGDHGA